MKLFRVLQRPPLDTYIAASMEAAKFDLLHAEDTLAEAKLRADFYRIKIDRLKALLPANNKSLQSVASLVPFKEKTIEK